ncbi:sulfotransferase [Alteromonas gracilis]|uniref:sulfotransferase n=1 Tax=Alteromonas gracilis TaxID=1479524 RepID=UPI002FE34DF3
MDTGKKLNSRPILITGSHRSGTTWVGNCIAASKDVLYIQEPFNIEHTPLGYKNPFRNWFQHINELNENEFATELDKLILKKPEISDYIYKNKGFKSNTKALLGYLKAKGKQLTNARPLLKDPIAFFSAEWINSRYQSQNIVVIRHPAAFISSLKLKNWQFDFNDFCNQPSLMNRYLSTFESEIIESAKNNNLDIIDIGILLWNCIHHTILSYQDKYPNWIYITHEQLSTSPVQEFEKIYDRLELEFTKKCQNTIKLSSGQHNPKEQIENNEFVRNSAENIYNWKSRLSKDEIARIKVGTGKIASFFYDKSQW